MCTYTFEWWHGLKALIWWFSTAKLPASLLELLKNAHFISPFRLYICVYTSVAVVDCCLVACNQFYDDVFFHIRHHRVNHAISLYEIERVMVFLIYPQLEQREGLLIWWHDQRVNDYNMNIRCTTNDNIFWYLSFLKCEHEFEYLPKIRYPTSIVNPIECNNMICACMCVRLCVRVFNIHIHKHTNSSQNIHILNTILYTQAIGHFPVGKYRTKFLSWRRFHFKAGARSLSLSIKK